MADLVKKDVKYLNKDFAQFRQNLINFAKNYFPDTYQDFNESSPGMMFMEMSSYVGDVLSYYTDASFKESYPMRKGQNFILRSQLILIMIQKLLYMKLMVVVMLLDIFLRNV